jgi:hypothetical protein
MRPETPPSWVQTPEGTFGRSELGLHGPLPRRTGLAAVVSNEQALVSQGHAQACGKTCDDGCHGDADAPLVCVRQAHPHRPDGEQGPADVVPHAGYRADGELVQWTCLPGDHDGLTAETRAIARAAASDSRAAQNTRRLLDGIDLTVLAEALAGPLAAAIARHGEDRQ